MCKKWKAPSISYTSSFFHFNIIFASFALSPLLTAFCMYVLFLLCLQTLPLYSTPLPLCPSVTADLCPVSAGPLLVAPSWRAVNRLGRGSASSTGAERGTPGRQAHRRQQQQQQHAIPAAFTTHTHTHVCLCLCCCNPNACAPASVDQRQIL